MYPISEENVWKLCEKLQSYGKLDALHVVFISNHNRMVWNMHCCTELCICVNISRYHCGVRRLLNHRTSWLFG